MSKKERSKLSLFLMRTGLRGTLKKESVSKRTYLRILLPRELLPESGSHCPVLSGKPNEVLPLAFSILLGDQNGWA